MEHEPFDHGLLAAAECQPVPDNIPNGVGRTTPLPPELYPLITAYDRDGATIATERLRPSATEQKGG